MGTKGDKSVEVSLAMQRRAALRQVCVAANVRRLVVYGNAWTCDSLRYASDFAPLEGHALAIVEDDAVRLLLEVQGEATYHVQDLEGCRDGSVLVAVHFCKEKENS